jgi:hypothetical protein
MVPGRAAEAEDISLRIQRLFFESISVTTYAPKRILDAKDEVVRERLSEIAGERRLAGMQGEQIPPAVPPLSSRLGTLGDGLAFAYSN